MKALILIGLMFLGNVHASTTVVFPVLNCDSQHATYLDVELEVGDGSKLTVQELTRIACININRLEHADKKRGIK